MSEGAKVFVIVVGCWQESVKCWDPCRRKHSGASDDWKWCKARTNKGSRKMEMVKKRGKGTNTCSNNKMQKYKFCDLLANPPTMNPDIGALPKCLARFSMSEKEGKRKTQTSRMIGNVAKEEKLAKNLRAMSRDFS